MAVGNATVIGASVGMGGRVGSGTNVGNGVGVGNCTVIAGCVGAMVGAGDGVLAEAFTAACRPIAPQPPSNVPILAIPITNFIEPFNLEGLRLVVIVVSTAVPVVAIVVFTAVVIIAMAAVTATIVVAAGV